MTFLRMARTLGIEAAAGQRAEILCALAIAEAEALLLADAEQTVDEAIAALSMGGTAMAGDREGALAGFLAKVAAALKDGGAPRVAWERLVGRGLAAVGERRDLVWARLALLQDRFEPVSRGAIVASRWRDHDPAAVALARAEGDENDCARSLAPFEERSRADTDAILRLARSWTYPPAAMRALDVGGRDLSFRHAAYREAEAAFEELLAAGERYGSIAAQAEALVQLVPCRASLGELALATETQRRAAELVARLGTEHRLHAVIAVMNGSLLAYLLDGDYHALAAGLARFLASDDAVHGPHGLLVAGLLAVARVRTGRDEEARRLLATLTPLLLASPPRTYVLNIAVASAAIAIWELALAEFAGEYESLARRLEAAGVGGTFFGVNDLTIARMRTLAGDSSGAAGGFARARAISEANGQRPLRAIVDYDEALAMIRAGRPGDRAHIERLLDAADAQCADLGMEVWRRRVASYRATVGRGAGRSGELPGGLTPRQVEILRLIAAGRTNKEIADDLSISLPTVERHLANIYARLDLRGRVEATAFALRHGIV